MGHVVSHTDILSYRHCFLPDIYQTYADIMQLLKLTCLLILKEETHNTYHYWIANIQFRVGGTWILLFSWWFHFVCICSSFCLRFNVLANFLMVIFSISTEGYYCQLYLVIKNTTNDNIVTITSIIFKLQVNCRGNCISCSVWWGPWHAWSVRSWQTWQCSMHRASGTGEWIYRQINKNNQEKSL